MNNDLSWKDAREARLDRAIDRAVREIMQIDPPPGLRRRVLARLNERREPRRHWAAQLAFGLVMLGMGLMFATRFWYRSELPAPPAAPAMAVAPLPTVDVDAAVRETIAKGQASIPGQITRERIPMPRVTNVFGTRSVQTSAATVDGRRRDVIVPPLRIVPLSARPIMLDPLVLPKGGQ